MFAQNVQTRIFLKNFLHSFSCASYVGCQGGEQPLYFSNICTVGNLCHEIMHALGLHHEHTRWDRDHYVTIEWENILPGRNGKRANFKKKKKIWFSFSIFLFQGKANNFSIKKGNTLNLPYDLKSIMHYGE